MKTDDWLTPQGVGDLVGGLSAQYIREEIRAGKLAAVYIRSRSGHGGLYRVRRVDADAYAARQLEQVLAPTSPARVSGPTLVTQTAPTAPCVKSKSRT